jgi:hypothetical protein
VPPLFLNVELCQINFSILPDDVKRIIGIVKRRPPAHKEALISVEIRASLLTSERFFYGWVGIIPKAWYIPSTRTSVSLRGLPMASSFFSPR